MTDPSTKTPEGIARSIWSLIHGMPTTEGIAAEIRKYGDQRAREALAAEQPKLDKPPKPTKRYVMFDAPVALGADVVPLSGCRWMLAVNLGQEAVALVLSRDEAGKIVAGTPLIVTHHATPISLSAEGKTE